MAAPSSDEYHSETGTAKGESIGLPQLQPEESLFASQLFWLILTFGFLYFVMSRVALPRIATVIEERRDKIALDLDRAEDFKQKTEEAIAAYETALGEARSRAHKTIDETRRRVSEEIEAQRKESAAQIEQKLKAAEGEIAAGREKALGHVRELAVGTAGEILTKVTPKMSTDNAVSGAVDEALSARGLG